MSEAHWCIRWLLGTYLKDSFFGVRIVWSECLMSAQVPAKSTGAFESDRRPISHHIRMAFFLCAHMFEAHDVFAGILTLF